ncbi:MAG: CehA/McbA family metallohydrolase [Planctomycetes bacterium]|nr:CehA/McbA family metallohydrolase [Planctomycetota bacterium]
MAKYLSPYSASSTRWLRGNLHGHTCCGRFMDLGESGRFYARLGYDFVAVTDHNKAPSKGQTAGWQQAAGLVVVPGEENGSTDHIIELGVHEVTPTNGSSYSERAEALRGGGGFIIACHPQEYPHGADNLRAGAPFLHAVEIYNGLREARGTHEHHNVALWDELLTAGRKLWAVAADDFHCQYISPGHGWVCVQAPEDAGALTWENIVEQLKRGAFYASNGPNFKRLEFRGGTLRVEVEKLVRDIRVIGPGGETLAAHPGPALSWKAPAGLGYFRVEAHCGVKTAWSQPFFAA